MEFEELCQYNFKGNFLSGFSLNSCWPNDDRYALFGLQKTSTIMKFQNTTDIIETANIKWNTIIDQMGIASQNISHKINKNIYSKSLILKRQELLLNPVYAIEYSKLPKESQNVQITWPKNFNENIVAVINQYGSCGIYTKCHQEGDFNDLKIYINDLLKDIFDYDPEKDIENIEELNESFRNFCITNCCWTDSQLSLFLCATESGWIIAFEVEQWTATYLFKIKTDLKSIRHMKCFSFTQNKTERLFLFAADTNGIVKIFEVYKHEFKEIRDLWSKNDKIPSQIIDMDYDCNIDKLFVSIVKASNLVVFVLSADGEICARTNYYLGNFRITGAQRFRPFEYILCTINGYMEHIEILYKLNENEIKIKGTPIKHNLQLDNNQILGMVATQNKVAWLFALYRNRFKMKTFGLISLCCLNIIDPFDIVNNSEDYHLENYTDCLEIIRVKIIREINTKNYINFYPKCIQINEKFLNQLRIRQVIVIGMISQIGQKNKNKLLEFEEEIQLIDNTILAIYICDRLRYLLHLKKLTNFQKLSLIFMKKYLLNYLEKKLTTHYTEIRNQITPVIELLLIDDGNMNCADPNKIIETCVYCEDEIDFSSMMCKNKHNMPRCCVSLTQVPIFTNRYCFRCKRVAHDDDNLLNEILCVEDTKRKFLCPFCNIPFIQIK